MPGPGGGSHGGGGFRGSGGSFGGGSRGGFSGGNRGGFHGGHHSPPPHHGGGFHGPHFGGGWHHRPHFGGGWYRRPHYSGGGCFGGLFTLIIIALFILFMGVYILIPSGNLTDLNNNSNSTVYDENVFQDYADMQYRNEFGSSSAYEDNILLVFLTEDENYYDYYYIAWVGDHIETEINYLFGNEHTAFGQSVADNINSNSYKYSLDSNIAHIIENMQNTIVSKSLESSFICNEDHLQVKSHITNKTAMDISEETVNSALQKFTEETGIPIVVVVDDINDVFESNIKSSSVVVNSNTGKYIVIGIAGIVVAVAIIVSVSYSKKRKKELENDNG